MIQLHDLVGKSVQDVILSIDKLQITLINIPHNGTETYIIKPQGTVYGTSQFSMNFRKNKQPSKLIGKTIKAVYFNKVCDDKQPNNSSGSFQTLYNIVIICDQDFRFVFELVYPHIIYSETITVEKVD